MELCKRGGKKENEMVNNYRQKGMKHCQVGATLVTIWRFAVIEAMGE